MSMIEFHMKGSGQVTPCPECGNDINFRAYSEQVCEDGCETWVACVCGYDPTEGKCGHRYENVWGGLDKDEINIALQVWEEELAS